MSALSYDISLFPQIVSNSPNTYGNYYNLRKMYCTHFHGATCHRHKVSCFPNRRRLKKGIKADNEGRERDAPLLSAGTPDTPVFTKRRVLFSFSLSLSLSLSLSSSSLSHRRQSSQCPDRAVRCVSRLTIYTEYEYANRGILLRARVRMIHVAPRSIYRQEQPVFTRY